MFSQSKRASVLWTGGKDSALALYEAQLKGFDIVNLVTFAPVGERFLAHPLDFIVHQAEALGLPHTIIGTKEPFKESYERAIYALKESGGIDMLVTGDIAEVDGYPNWIRECCESSRMEVYTPLWRSDRTVLMKRLISNDFKVIFSCVRRPWFTADWIAKPLEIQMLGQLQKMNADKGLDICGEQGEYHTLVLDGPSFKKQICIASYSTYKEESFMCIDIHDIKLCDKGKP